MWLSEGIDQIFAGVLHPLIHLGYGIEFEQPAIVAEALGQTAIHSPWLDKYFPAVDEIAQRKQTAPKSLVAILDDIFADEKLSTAAHWDDEDLTRDGVFARAWDSMVEHASNWRVHPDEVEEASAELANAAGEFPISAGLAWRAYTEHRTAYLAGSAQRPPKEVKFGKPRNCPISSVRSFNLRALSAVAIEKHAKLSL